jgi:hypothetical protein
MTIYNIDYISITTTDNPTSDFALSVCRIVGIWKFYEINFNCVSSLIGSVVPLVFLNALSISCLLKLFNSNSITSTFLIVSSTR